MRSVATGTLRIGVAGADTNHAIQSGSREQEDLTTATPSPSERYVSDSRLVQARQIDPPAATGGDGRLSMWLTGTGTPVVQIGRAGPSNLIRVNDDVIVVDCGNAVSYRLAELGVELHDLTHVFVTHHHVDHNVDLAYLLLSPLSQPRKGQYVPPVIIGPPGTYVFVNRLFAAHEYDLLVRQAHTQDFSGLELRVVEVEDGTLLGGDGWRAEAVRVDHHPVDEAFGYRFDTDDVSVVVSGDTRPDDHLVERASGADVLVHECLFPGFGIPDYHTAAPDVGPIARRAGVDHLVLTHLIPGHLDDRQWIEAIQPTYDGRITVGRDLLQII